MNNEPKLDELLNGAASAWVGHREFAIWLVKQMNPEVTVDLGVDYGHSTFILAAPDIGKVYGIDSFEGDEHAGTRDTYSYVNYTKNFFNFDNTTFIKGYFDKVAETWTQKIDILHIDGLHTYDAVKYDYETWKQFLKDDSVILFHDVEAFKDSVGKFFNELDLHKCQFDHSAGLGVASKNPKIINLIKDTFNLRKNIAVFFHMLDWPQGRQILESQIDTIVSSEIMEHSQLFFHCNYDIANYRWLQERLHNYKNVMYIDKGIHPRDYEVSTLMHLKEYCDNDPGESHILYLHHKGISKSTSEPVRDWRDLMMYFNVTQWRDCVEKLDQGYDTAGAIWRGNYHYPHYSGNFWWAKSSYIKRLPVFRMPGENGYQSQFGFVNSPYKEDAEFWLGLGNPNPYCFYNSGLDHYEQLCPPELYRK